MLEDVAKCESYANTMAVLPSAAGMSLYFALWLMLDTTPSRQWQRPGNRLPSSR
jgi:hypothetical protein